MSAPDYSAWVGRTEETEDMVTAAQMEGMAATLGRDDPLPEQGDPLPPMWQWMFFSAKAKRSEVGPDGHPKRGGFMPPVELPRRMFAGGRFEFLQPLRVGDSIRRVSKILKVDSKQGRSGHLVFVTVGHTILTERGAAIEEENDIVYREAAPPGQSQAPPAPKQPDKVEGPWRQRIEADPVMLFRFSALTFNGHRIHYDRPYVTEIEGYPGLIVHGPMLATLLADLARDNGGRPLARFEFRAKRPVFDTDPFELVGGPDGEDGYWCRVLDAAGAIAMEAGGSYGRG